MSTVTTFNIAQIPELLRIPVEATDRGYLRILAISKWHLRFLYWF